MTQDSKIQAPSNVHLMMAAPLQNQWVVLLMDPTLDGIQQEHMCLSNSQSNDAIWISCFPQFKYLITIFSSLSLASLSHRMNIQISDQA